MNSEILDISIRTILDHQPHIQISNGSFWKNKFIKEYKKLQNAA